MSVQNVIGDSFRGATWVALHNGGGVGFGEVMNGKKFCISPFFRDKYFFFLKVDLVCFLMEVQKRMIIFDKCYIGMSSMGLVVDHGQEIKMRVKR